MVQFLAQSNKRFLSYSQKTEKWPYNLICIINLKENEPKYVSSLIYQSDHKTQGHLWGGIWPEYQGTFIGLDKKKWLCLVKKSQNFFLCTPIFSNGWLLKIWVKSGLHAKFGLWGPSRSRVMDFWKLVVFQKNGYFSKFWWFFTAKLGHSAANRARS